ncbi:TerB N-terminal domain-containing protein [Streptomyces sp. NP160]|uniref:tellurite resistance TerB family protein n=1 Tax=Streptomyces sp. NP160 TaxID=2586637 RepID=UPI00214B60A1|nr:TerB N-terminal domain-containing protein [Streptomyces sp. NP160]
MAPPPPPPQDHDGQSFITPSRVLSRAPESTPQQHSPRVVQRPPSQTAPRPTSAPPARAPRQSGPKSLWIAPGAEVRIGPLLLPGGMLYVGQRLQAGNGYGIEPALINPHLDVDHRRPDWAGETVGYWPSFSDISPRARGAYLSWLAAGRVGPVPISWVFLFFYGLERRVIVDATRAGTPARADLPAIRTEVERLLGLYGTNHSFRRYATEFLSVIDLADGLTHEDAVPPERVAERWPVPHTLRLKLGELANAGTPVPAEWALAWVHFNMNIHLRTPAQRCPEEFEQLFLSRYSAKYGPGMVVKPNKTLVKHQYHSASSGLGSVELSAAVPDVLELAAPTTKLERLVTDCTDALDAYSRLLGRRPEARGTLAASALLPPELITDTTGDLARLRAWVTARTDSGAPVPVDAQELLAFWPAEIPGQLTKAEAVGLIQLLGSQGVGIEPDLRFGGPILGPGSAVLFTTGRRAPTTASPSYTAAATMLHLAAAVCAADGRSSGAETAHLQAHLESSMDLSAGERARLQAHMTWLLSGQIKLTGLSKRLATLGVTQRESLGDFLATVAAADREVTPSEVDILTKIFKLLGLDTASVYSRLHTSTTAGPPAAQGPVVVRAASSRKTGYAIPAPPRVDEVKPSGTPGRSQVRLDSAAIEAKLAETHAVSMLLGSIFTEEPDDVVATPAPKAADAPPPVAGLDTAHSALLRVLVTRARWSRADLEAECANLSLLPDGALDTLNEAAYDVTGDPVVEGDNLIDINTDVAAEMLT